MTINVPAGDLCLAAADPQRKWPEKAVFGEPIGFSTYYRAATLDAWSIILAL
jgi:hypothetical protein